jgi:hypothetical protein
LDEGSTVIQRRDLISFPPPVRVRLAPRNTRRKRKERMTRLNQIVALEKGLKGRTATAITAIHHLLQKPGPFTGLSRVYRPKDEEGEQLPPEKTLVQTTVKDQLDEASRLLTNLFDVVATKEWANTGANADIVVDGRVLVSGAPVPYLLFLEKELINWRTLVSKVQVLDAAEVWTYDEANTQYRTEPTETARAKKVLKVLTLAPATDKHPAQTQTYTEDVPVGTWATTKFSGAIPAKARDELVERANKLIDAVKAAREEANSCEIQDEEVAEGLFEYLLP